MVNAIVPAGRRGLIQSKKNRYSLTNRQDSHVRVVNTKRGKKAVLVNPDIHKKKLAPRPIMRNNAVIKPVFQPKIQLAPRAQPEGELWQKLMKRSELEPYFDFINNNVDLIKKEIYDKIRNDYMKDHKMSEEEAIEEFIDKVEGDWDNRWGKQDQVFIKRFGNWDNYAITEVKPAPSINEDWDAVWSEENDPFDGEIFLKNQGTHFNHRPNLVYNHEFFSFLDMATSNLATDLLRNNIFENRYQGMKRIDPAAIKKINKSLGVGMDTSAHRNMDFDISLLRRLVKEKIPFMHAKISAYGPPGIIIFPQEEASKVERIYEEEKKKWRPDFKFFYGDLHSLNKP